MAPEYGQKICTGERLDDKAPIPGEGIEHEIVHMPLFEQ